MDANQMNVTRPKGYKQITYAPVKKVDSEDKLATLDQTALQHSYTFWVKIQGQAFNKKKQETQFGDELIEIDSVSTVSPQTRILT